MSNIIPVPVTVSVGILVDEEGRGTVRNFGAFRLVPYATTRGGSLNISRWLLLPVNGEPEELEDVSLFAVFPKKLLWHVCQHTFESEKESVPLALTIDDQRWTFPMCARELEYEQVHYMIDIEGEWMRLSDVALNELINEEQFIFAEREVLPTIDFGDPSEVMDQMN